MRTIEQLENEIRERGVTLRYSPEWVALEIDGREVAREPMPTGRFVADGMEDDPPFAPPPLPLNCPGPVCCDALARYLHLTAEEVQAYGASWDAQAQAFQRMANAMGAEIRVPREATIITTRPGYKGRFVIP